MNKTRAVTNHETSAGLLPQRVTWAVLAGALIVLAGLWWPGCKEYPEATSRESLDLMKALYSACNAKNAEWLARVEKEVSEASESGEMSEKEAAAFGRIISVARSGDWQSAQEASFRFNQDQLR